ncbi:alpha/beta hydrolase [Candidatus Pelagibacter sp.]|nr:alpha/beta hydrolase [Candidatus Pelagibacter sp.]
MKKILIVVIFGLISCGNVFANGKILKSGFITKSASVNESMNIEDPKNKIIIIYNHGQNKNDKAIKNECIWINQIRNQASLVDQEVNNKKIMVYNFCTNDLAGDMSPKKYWKFKEPYEGVHKLDKRIEKNLELVDKFVKIGVPRKQIIISGHSCGGLLTLMLLAAHPEKVGGGISYMQACYGKLSSKYKVKKVGTEEALAKFAKKYPGGAELRQRQIDNIKKLNNVPVLAFTHPKDKYEGLLSDWLEEVPGVKRIVISEDYKINGKTCVAKGDNSEWKVSESKNAGHIMNQGLCFQYYNPVILDYIASSTK